MSLKYLRNKIKLLKLPNGLTWIHINDHKLKDTSSGNFRVEVGSYDEIRENVENGVAHLLEHSLFLKNTNQEKSLFINWNANTASQATNYLFSTSNKNFKAGFEVYWNNLINFEPLEKIRDELSNVDSE